MNNFNPEREWEFITAEVHSKKARKMSEMKREILLVLQILLGKMEIKNYLALKKIYNGN